MRSPYQPPTGLSSARPQASIVPAAASFFSLRRQTVEKLRELDYEQWERTGTHAFFGTTTLQELINLAVQHDQAHWQQVLELLSGAE